MRLRRRIGVVVRRRCDPGRRNRLRSRLARNVGDGDADVATAERDDRRVDHVPPLSAEGPRPGGSAGVHDTVLDLAVLPEGHQIERSAVAHRRMMLSGLLGLLHPRPIDLGRDVQLRGALTRTRRSEESRK